MWLSPKWFCFLFIYFVLYHGPEASKVQISLLPILTFTQEAPDPGCCLAIDMRIHSMSVLVYGNVLYVVYVCTVCMYACVYVGMYVLYVCMCVC